MGYGNYSLEAHQAMTQARAALPQEAVFSGKSCDPAMNPHGVGFRQARDSAEHPNSVGIVFALDVSGSMGEIPHQLATRTLPSFMQAVLTVLPDPQVLFVAFGNAYADRSPLQVGQFESEAPLIDKWLAATHIEGGGGGLGESYDLAMYFAARHTAMDCLEKRSHKGYFFMTGDEPAFTHLEASKVQQVLGDRLEANIEIHELTAELLKSFHAFFLIPDAARAAEYSVGGVWQTLLRERCIILATPEDTAVVCALLVGITEGRFRTAAEIGAQLETHLGRHGEERDRVVRVVVPYAEALARGDIAPPGTLHRRTDDTGLRG